MWLESVRERMTSLVFCLFPGIYLPWWLAQQKAGPYLGLTPRRYHHGAKILGFPGGSREGLRGWAHGTDAGLDRFLTCKARSLS